MNGKPVYVLDATPVIYLAKIGKLELLCEISRPVITEEVYNESSEGEYPDALLVRDLVHEDALHIYKVEERDIVEALLRHPEIHSGEAETLAAAKILGGLAVVDDAEARTVAKIYGIDQAPGTLFLLFKLLSDGIIGSGEASRMLDDLVDNGLYLDSKTLLRAKKRLDDYTHKRADPE